MPLPELPRYDPEPLWLGQGLSQLPPHTLGRVGQFVQSLDTSATCGSFGVCVPAAALPADAGRAQALAAALHTRTLKCVLDLTPPPGGWDDVGWSHALAFAAQVGALGVAVPALAPADCAQVMARLADQPPRPRPWVLVDSTACPSPKPVGHLRSVRLALGGGTGSAALDMHTRIRLALRATRSDVLVWGMLGPHAGAPAMADATRAQAPGATPAQTRVLGAVLGSCLRGAYWLPLPEGPDAQAHAQWLGHFSRWRAGFPALQRGSMALLPAHPELLAWVRQEDASQVLCLVNLSDRYVRHPVGRRYPQARMLAGSGLHGGRLVHGDADLDPWGMLFVQL